MGIRRELERKIEKKTEEVHGLERALTEGVAFLEGLKEALKSVPRDEDADKVATLRHGSDLEKARDFLSRHKKPAYVGAILKGIGKEDTKSNRASLSGSLGAYARKKEIFVKTLPNTFGLKGMEEPVDSSAPPSNFGLPTKDEERRLGAIPT